jgi:hypothetical protein
LKRRIAGTDSSPLLETPQQADFGPLNADQPSSGLTTVAEQLIQEFSHDRAAI